MANPVISNSRLSLAMERTDQWVFSQEVPTDVVVEVGEANYNLHKFMLVAKSKYIRKLIMETKEADLTRINLSDIPRGPEIFEKAAKFCYGINFQITVHNVAALLCAAEYLQMTDKYSDSNLAGRTEDFLSQVALSSVSGPSSSLNRAKICFPWQRSLKLFKDSLMSRVLGEANFRCRTPPIWWTEELSILEVEFFGRIICAMKQWGAKALTLATALITYSLRWLRDPVRDHSGNGIMCSDPTDSDLRIQQRELLEYIVALLPAEKAAFPIHFLCCLLRCAIFLKASTACKNKLEKRIYVILEHATVDGLLVLSFTHDVEMLFDLDSVRRIISGFVEEGMAVS